MKGITKAIENETKEQKGGFLDFYFRTSLLGNMLTGKGILRAGYGKGMLRAGYGSKIDFQCRLIL